MTTTARTADRTRLLATELAGETDFLTARIRSLGTARANRELAPFDLKVRSYSVLSLACSGQTPSQREMADFLFLDPSQIVALVDELEGRGLLQREADSRDRRSKVVTGTAAGQRLYQKARAATLTAEEETLAGLDEAEREQLRGLLARVAFPAV
jgi:DNA-binding MarR family transcriptional regulator